MNKLYSNLIPQRDFKAAHLTMGLLIQSQARQFIFKGARLSSRLHPHLYFKSYPQTHPRRSYSKDI